MSDTYFVPKMVNVYKRNSFRLVYILSAIVCMILFIYGIAQTDSTMVAISVCVMLGVTILGCGFARCCDRHCVDILPDDIEKNYRAVYN